MSSASPTILPLAPALEWRPKHNPYVIALVVTMATFMEVLDTSIANVALPHIAGNLSASLDESTWVLTSYLVSNAVVLPLSGWLSGVFGRKRFYMTCVALFTISSCLCGLAPSLGWLVVFRILQGVGGGGLQPSEQAILVDTFPRNKRGMGMAVYGIAVVVAPIVGPTLGGWITDNYSWRWIFFINIPVGLMSLMLTSQLVQDPPYVRGTGFKKGFRVDYIGLGLIAVGLGFLQIVLDKGEREDWFSSNFIVICALIAGVGLLFAIVWEWHNKEPMVDIHLLKDRNFFVATFLMFMTGFVLYGSLMLLPLYLQTMMGYNATWAGLALSPGGLATMALMPLVGTLLGKVQARWLVAVGLTITGLSLLYMSKFSLQMDFNMAMYSRIFMAFGLAFLFLPINNAAFDFVPKGKNNNASGLINLARNLGGSFGIALATTLLSRQAQVHQTVLAAHITPYDPHVQATLAGIKESLMAAGMSAPDAAQQALGLMYQMTLRQAGVLAFVDDFRLLGILFLAMIPLVLLLRKTRPHKGGGMH